MSSLYERIGGEAAVMAAVDLFYRKVTDDPVTKPFFEGLDMDKQVQKQVSFMTWAFGGPDAYKGRDLTAAHARLVNEEGLSDPHFDAIASHLQETLEEMGVEKPLIDEALGIIAPTRDAVLGREGHGG